MIDPPRDNIQGWEIIILSALGSIAIINGLLVDFAHTNRFIFAES